MGISIDVDSIVTPKDRHPFGPSDYQDYQYADLRALCQVFGWSSVPWLEPSPTRGATDTSCNSTRYYRLLAVARAYARGTSLRIYNEEQPPVLIDNERQLFPHLLIRAIWSNYYLPVDFDLPRQFEGTWGIISVGSSMRLHRELSHLVPVISKLQAQTTAEEATINDANELCTLFLNATQESMTLNLPLLLRG
jgi:hypothetical protein